MSNAKKLPLLRVDLDGVMANYSKRWRDLGGHEDDKGSKKAWRFKQPQFEHFYRHLELMPDAMELWHYVTKVCHEGLAEGPEILSAKSNFQSTSYADKIWWCEHHLHISGPRVVIVDYPNHKAKLVHKDRQDILIDDTAKNISEWQNAGGVGILHHTAKKTIAALEAILRPARHVHEAFNTLAVTSNLQKAFDEME